MSDNYVYLARLLGTDPIGLERLDGLMSRVSGHRGVVGHILQENAISIERTLHTVGLKRSSHSGEVRAALHRELATIDQELFVTLGKPDLTNASQTCGQLFARLRDIQKPPRGLFLKHTSIERLLSLDPPRPLLDHFGIAAVGELLAQKGIAPVMSALRFVMPTEWMHQFFDRAYSTITTDDFEERDVEIIVLDPEWLDVAQTFVKKKYHNVSHLKELGIIFVIPLKIDTPGEMLRLFTLLLHYLHEVPFYAGLFRQIMAGPDFIPKFQSLLRGDVPETSMPTSDRAVFRIVQRYLGKENPEDSRLREPRLNPEAQHWYQVERDLGKLSLSAWSELGYVGDYFEDDLHRPDLISFSLIDLVMSLVMNDHTHYRYHQPEAMWNKFFVEHLGSDRMNAEVRQHIFDGYVTI